MNLKNIKKIQGIINNSNMPREKLLTIIDKIPSNIFQNMDLKKLQKFRIFH